MYIMCVRCMNFSIRPMNCMFWRCSRN